jgi:5-methylcytosine-specific restriction protein A
MPIKITIGKLMGRKDSKRYKSHNEQPVLMLGDLPPSDIEEEKIKARKLRHSAWWKRRIADGICQYCKGHFHPDELTMDHIIPLARGGTSEKINIVPCCKECNSKKKYMLPVEWEEYLSKLKDQ